MVILDGDEAGLIHASGMVAADPNPEHLREARLAIGRDPGIGNLLADSISGSSLLSYAIRGRAAIVCGVGLLGITRFKVWMTTTAPAVDRPNWLWRESMRSIKAFDRIMGQGTIYWQEIPPDYERGLHFVQHLGFTETRRVASPITGEEFVLVEREVPEWDS